MVFPIVGGTQSTGYEIDNSLRYNNPDDPSLAITFGSAGNRKTFTISAWIKRGNIADNRTIFGQGTASNPRGLFFLADQQLRMTNTNDGTTNDMDVQTSAVLRDASAWYHVVAAVDVTQGTDTNRVKLYINGELQTSFANATYPAQNTDLNWNNTVLHAVGRYPASDAHHWDGYISEFYFIDGTQYAASDFGETDDNGVWIPKAASVTFGTNGFKLEFQQTGTGTASASTIGADTSGNTNHLTSTNLAATDITTDSPTNNFMTGNPLAIINGSEAPTRIPDYSEGNTVATASNGTTRYLLGTFATSMPYYFEVKVLSTSSTDSSQRIGIVDAEAISNATTYNVAYQADGVITATGESNATGKQSITANDIIGVAVDLATNNNVKLYHNGTLQATMSVGSSYQSLLTTPFARLVDATQSFSFNFGNPSFAISSGNADANGYGNFEYAVPSGYYALCTKNLAEYG
jgi:hypothetical protein